MNFNSPEFLLFFPGVVFLYALVFRRDLLRTLLLLFASYAFYMSWNWKYAGLIAFSTLVDYLVGLELARRDAPRVRRALLVTSLTANLGLLGLFKYYNFFLESTEATAHLFGWEFSFPGHSLLLPVGISFYTFQSLSYTIDLYRRQIGVERSLLRFAVYVAFFPQLVAGPIVRAKDFLPQLRVTPPVSGRRVDEGMALIFRGLFKKVVIADLLASLGVDAVFANPGAYSSWDLLFAVYGYSFQIYNDFSGYSDIAIGAARVMGFDIPRNFDRPYLSQNLREFWTRWHISLSTWLRDYLYISLGGNRGRPMRVAVNLFLTMLLGGLWHGAAWNFVLWGAFHGFLLLGGRRGERRPVRDGFARTWRQLACFHLVVFGWLLFRIESMGDLATYLRGLLDLSGGTQLAPLFYLVLSLGVALHLWPSRWYDQLEAIFLARPVGLQAAAYAAGLLVFLGATVGAPAFIYFQF
jgi:alginate O-acetyltransferase complex protein AlgI